MTTISQESANRPQTPAKRAKALSPELSEFLHMLDALEGQLSGQRVQ